MSNIVFYTDKITPNYLESPYYYRFRKGMFAFNGKYIHSNYLYWILKNHGIDNVKLVTSVGEVSENDVLFFHYDFKDNIPKKTDFVKVQIVSDRPLLEWSDFFCVNDPSKLANNILLFEPLPIDLKLKNIQFPPKRFHSNCAEFYVLDEFKDKKNIKRLLDNNIKVSFEHDRHVSLIDFDVFFFLRNTNHLNDLNNRGEKKHLSSTNSYKNACRLFQSWHMGVPGIFSDHSSMNFEKKSNLDFLSANTFEEFLQACITLKTDKDLFYNILDNCNVRKKEISNHIITRQIVEAFNNIKALRDQNN
jgi:hypothetical protein